MNGLLSDPYRSCDLMVCFFENENSVAKFSDQPGDKQKPISATKLLTAGMRGKCFDRSKSSFTYSGHWDVKTCFRELGEVTFNTLQKQTGKNCRSRK